MHAQGQSIDFCAASTPQELTIHPMDGKPLPETIAMLLMSQAPALLALSMYHDAMPQQYLGAVASLRSLTRLTVRRQRAHMQCSTYVLMQSRHNMKWFASQGPVITWVVCRLPSCKPPVLTTESGNTPNTARSPVFP